MLTKFEDRIWITSHAVGLIDPTAHKDGKVTFSVPSYYKRFGEFSKRHIVETGEVGERISDTIQRALDYEIAEYPGSATLELTEDSPFHVFFDKDQNNPGGTHLKLFFLAHVSGQRRTTKPRDDGREEIGPMVDTEAEKLISAMEREHTVPIHLEVTKMALNYLAKEDSSVYWRYARLVARCSTRIDISPEMWKAIYAYDKWF
jgi:hypothetical protein